MEDIHIFERRVKSLHEENKEEIESQESFYKDQIKILEARVKELDEKMKELGPAMANLHTPYQYNSNLSIEEDSNLKNGKLPSNSNED
ncbi:hypothetical protein F3Y22_tig00117032pilonHSYRG00195 [Hibiscus syriacus]|uniref:Uncharacterized protein n=2 Tax=Hibiscus syriacus TaxID=106335 RepID=A0A6A2WDS2_HIBSY|nr:hypothetical protein F3Y22_tig00117032pilonHSYRG00195 [Hibiscus syriacus]